MKQQKAATLAARHSAQDCVSFSAGIIRPDGKNAPFQARET